MRTSRCGTGMTTPRLRKSSRIARVISPLAAPKSCTWTQGFTPIMTDQSLSCIVRTMGAGSGRMRELLRRTSSIEGGAHVGVVGNADGDVELADLAEVMEDLACDFAVWNDDAGAVQVAQGGVEQ